ncbi:MAG: hypothetical protein LBD43_00330 [Holosporales bacterium]|jgi:hypothetical protein|nr:hypothetical protein [Holosporales bacterium]
MMLKILWAAIVVLSAGYALFSASLGFDIPVAHYEKLDIVMVENGNRFNSRLGSKEMHSP